MDLKEHRHHSYVVYLMKQSNPGPHVRPPPHTHFSSHKKQINSGVLSPLTRHKKRFLIRFDAPCVSICLLEAPVDEILDSFVSFSHRNVAFGLVISWRRKVDPCRQFLRQQARLLSFPGVTLNHLLRHLQLPFALPDNTTVAVMRGGSWEVVKDEMCFKFSGVFSKNMANVNWETDVIRYVQR